MKIIASVLLLATAGLATAQGLRDKTLFHIPVSGAFTDAGPNNLTITANGSPAGTADSRGNSNQAIQLNGTTQYLSISQAAAVQKKLPLSFSVWIKLDQVSGNFPVFCTDNSTSAYAGIFVQILNGRVFMSYGDGLNIGSGNRVSLQGSATLQASKWYHIAGIIRGFQDMELYIDGARDKSATYDGAGSFTAMKYTGAAMAVGYFSGKNGGAAAYFSGAIDDLHIWNRELTAEEIDLKKRMLAGYFFNADDPAADEGPFQLQLANQSTSSSSDRFSRNSYAMTFDGSSARSGLPNNNLYKIAFPFTISAWVNISAQKAMQPIFATSDHLANKYTGTLLYLDNGRPALMTGDNAGAGQQFRTSYIAADSINVGQWYQITAVCNGINDYKLYLNSVLITNASSSGTGTSMVQGSGQGYIGYLSDPTGGAARYFKGKIDDVMLLAGALNAAQISALNRRLFITDEPADTTVIAGNNAAMGITAISTESMQYQWYKYSGSSWNLLSGKISSVLSFSNVSFSDTGRYRCVVSTKNYKDTSGTAILNATVVNQTRAHENSGFTVYPVPAKDMIYFSMPAIGSGISILDPSGKLIRKATVSDCNCLPVSDLPGGIYILQADAPNGGPVLRRFVKN